MTGAEYFEDEITEEQLADLKLEELHDLMIQMDRAKDKIKRFYKNMDTVLEFVADTHPNLSDVHFQDDEGVVYQMAPWTGQFVVAKNVVLHRTRRGEERAGELSLTKARELGYVVEGK